MHGRDGVFGDAHKVLLLRTSSTDTWRFPSFRLIILAMRWDVAQKKPLSMSGGTDDGIDASVRSLGRFLHCWMARTYAGEVGVELAMR